MKSDGALSIKFTSMLRMLGILRPKWESLGGDRRTVAEKLFRNIRHTVVTMLRSSNIVSADMPREIVDHDLEMAELAYFNPALEEKLKGLSFLEELREQSLRSVAQGFVRIDRRIPGFCNS